MATVDSTLIAPPGTLVPGLGVQTAAAASTAAVTTSTASTATAYSNQRKIDRTSNGVLWAIYSGDSGASANAWYPRYSTDNGATWTGSSAFTGPGGASTTYTPNASFFIDQDDYCHIVFKDGGNGYIYYRRGTPNAGRTAWTWSAAQLLRDVNYADYPDVIAHREGTGWRAHFVWSEQNTEPRYLAVTVSSAGAFSYTIPTTLATSTQASGSHAFPSIDFNHTGDGKTVAGGTPHLYAAWSAGATGAGKGIRFRKATYSGGSWTWGTEREIDSNAYVGGTNRHITCMFTGTRIYIAGIVDYSGVANSVVAVYERNSADTTTTPWTLNTGTFELYFGSTTYDSNENVFFIGKGWVSPNSTVSYRKWNRGTSTLEASVVIDSTNVNDPYVSAKRGYSNDRIEFIYTDGTASPYSVTYGQLSLSNPTMPSITTLGDVANTGSFTSVVTGGWTNEAVIADSTAYSNQRKIDRTSDGVVWSTVQQGSPDDIFFHYSTDSGRTWNLGTGASVGIRPSGTSFSGNWSFFIDQDDYAHVVYKQMSQGYVYYTRGTLNANRDGWSWSNPGIVSQSTVTALDYPDVVAHREGTGWAVHIVMSFGGINNNVSYTRLNVTSGGTITVTSGPGYLTSGYNNNNHTFASIDFNHTGDGKTVAGGTPHVYVAWSAGATGTGKGIRFRKATYSGGTWTWETEREIDSTRYVQGAKHWLNCMFDGTRVVMAGFLYGNAVDTMWIVDRDAADTTTSSIYAYSPASDAALGYGSATYDSAGDVWFFGVNEDEALGARDLVHRRWDRSANGIVAEAVVDENVANAYVSVQRGYSDDRIEFIYTKGSGSYSVTYGQLSLDPPTPPSITTLEEPNLWDRVNLVSNPSFETGTTGWVSQVGSPTFATSTAQSSSGSYSLAMTATSGSQATGGMALTMDIPVRPGSTYRFQYKSRASTTGRSCQPWVFWLDSAGGSLDLVMGSGTTNNTSAWALASTNAITAPAAAAYARVYVRIGGTGGVSPAAGEVHYFDDVLFEQDSALGAYFDGDTIASGKQYGWFTNEYGQTVSGEESLLQVESGSAGFSGSGSLSLTPSPGFARSGVLSGSGTLTRAWVAKPIQTVQLSGSGTLSVSNLVRQFIQTTQFSGSGTLSLTRGPVTLTGPGVLSGAGTLVPTFRIGVTRAGVLSGSGTLTIPTRVAGFARSGVLSGVGVLALAGVRLYAATASGYATTASGWVNSANAQGADDSAYATWTSSTANAVSPALRADFGTWAGLPGDAQVQKVVVRIKGFSSHE